MKVLGCLVIKLLIKSYITRNGFDAYVNVVGRYDFVGAIYGVLQDVERYLIIMILLV